MKGTVKHWQLDPYHLGAFAGFYPYQVYINQTLSIDLLRCYCVLLYFTLVQDTKFDNIQRRPVNYSTDHSTRLIVLVLESPFL